MSKQVTDMIKVIDNGVSPLVIDVDGDGENVRVIAEVFDHAEGIVFADIGFCRLDHPGHPYHIVEGELSGDGPWEVGNAKIFTIDDSNDLFFDWYEWEQNKERVGCTREVARQGIKNDIGFGTEP